MCFIHTLIIWSTVYELQPLNLDLLNVLQPPLCTLGTHHSLLAKLGRWGWGWLERKTRRQMRMRLAWKKNQKTIDASNRLHQNKTRSGQRTSQLCNYWELQTRKWVGLSLPKGSGNPYPGAPHTTGLLMEGRPQSNNLCFVWGVVGLRSKSIALQTTLQAPPM